MTAAQQKYDGQADLHRLINREIADEYGRELSFNEKTVLAYCERAAEENRELEPKDTIAHEMGLIGMGGSIRGIMLRLEQKGFIKTEFYQRGRRVQILSSGKWTKAPRNTSPHWRTIFDHSRKSTPALPIHTVAQKVPNAAMWINTEARASNRPLADVMVELICRGIACAEADRAEAA